MALATIQFDEKATAAETGEIVMTTAERDLALSGHLSAWIHAHWDDVKAEGIRNALNNSFAEPVISGNLPTRSATGGPDGTKVLIADDADGQIFRSVAGKFPANADWTVAFVAKAGTASASTIFGVAGDSGNAIGFRLRTGDIFQVMTYNSAGSATTQLSVACTSADPHLVVVTYDESTSTLTIYVDGAEAGTVTYDFAYSSSRYTLFGAYDDSVSGDLTTTYFDDGELSWLIIATVDADQDSAFMGLIEAACASRYPSITLA